MPLMSIRLATVLLASSISCSSLPRMTDATDSPFTGTWTQREAVAGTSFVVTLTVEGTSVRSTGSFTAPEGRTGTLAGKGDIAGERLLLAFTYDNGKLAQLDLERASASVLTGSLHFGDPRSLTPSAIVTFDRKK